MADGFVPMSPVGYGHRKKSNAWTWFFLTIVMLALATMVGFHYGVNDFLKVSADKQAIAANPIPLIVPKQSSGSTTSLFWRDETFEDGLRCRLFKKKGTGAKSDFAHPDAVSCDWASLPKE